MALCVSPGLAAGARAAAPEDLIKDLLVAAQRGDVDGFLSGLTTDSRKSLTEAVAHQAALSRALEQFQQALDERFGAGTEMLASPPDDLPAALARFVNAEVIAQREAPDGAVQLQVKTSLKTGNGETITREETLVVWQEAGAWKLVLGFAANGKLAVERGAAAERIVQEVRDGKHKDRLSAMIALANAWMRQKGPKP
jgi:hypothetical protein